MARTKTKPKHRSPSTALVAAFTPTDDAALWAKHGKREWRIAVQTPPSAREREAAAKTAQDVWWNLDAHFAPVIDRVRREIAPAERPVQSAAAVSKSKQAETAGVETEEALRAAKDVFRPLRKWDGVVLSMRDDVFRARLFDESADEPEAEADIYVSEVPPQDRSLLTPGSLFYWHIGYRDTPSGDRERVSRIRFRRLPPPSAADRKRAVQKADELRASFGWS
jgi:hypothetical protein